MTDHVAKLKAEAETFSVSYFYEYHGAIVRLLPIDEATGKTLCRCTRGVPIYYWHGEDDPESIYIWPRALDGLGTLFCAAVVPTEDETDVQRRGEGSAH